MTTAFRNNRKSYSMHLDTKYELQDGPTARRIQSIYGCSYSRGLQWV